MVELLLYYGAAVNAKIDNGNKCATRRAQCAHALVRVCMRSVPLNSTGRTSHVRVVGPVSRMCAGRDAQAGCDAVKQPSIVRLGRRTTAPSGSSSATVRTRPSSTRRCATVAPAIHSPVCGPVIFGGGMQEDAEGLRPRPGRV